ncbi:hypothetical protein [Acinetobacter baumannii]|uniref:hypothetical protein n=1 Tax=Acinetobacter baumannii TaxID=470 RepID=UPI002340F59F|nr:hypothetical protein [Acinetobacter baumannii]MDC4147569.1 hypothetical protein [Acinetobacter baumannii]
MKEIIVLVLFIAAYVAYQYGINSFEEKQERIAQMKKEKCVLVKVDDTSKQKYLYKCEGGKEYILNDNYDLN